MGNTPVDPYPYNQVTPWNLYHQEGGRVELSVVLGAMTYRQASETVFFLTGQRDVMQLSAGYWLTRVDGRNHAHPVVSHHSLNLAKAEVAMLERLAQRKLGLARLAYIRLHTKREREAVEVAECRHAPPGRIKTLKSWQADAEALAAVLFDAIIRGEIEP